MYVSAEQIAATGKAGMDALITLGQAQFAAFEQVSVLNFNTGKVVFEDGIKHAKALMSVKGARDLVELNAAAAQPAFEKAIAYSRDLNSVAARARAEVSKLSESRAVELNRTAISLLDNMTKTAPVGLGVAVSAIKSVLAAANAAYESYTRVAKQAADMAEANIVPPTVVRAKQAGKKKAV